MQDKLIEGEGKMVKLLGSNFEKGKEEGLEKYNIYRYKSI